MSIELWDRLQYQICDDVLTAVEFQSAEHARKRVANFLSDTFYTLLKEDSAPKGNSVLVTGNSFITQCNGGIFYTRCRDSGGIQTL